MYEYVGVGVTVGVCGGPPAPGGGMWGLAVAVAVAVCGGPPAPGGGMYEYVGVTVGVR